MGKQKLLPQFQVKGSGLDNLSSTASPLRNMNKRNSRKIWILSFLIISTLIFIWFPPSFTLFTWSSEYHSSVDPLPLVVYLKDESRVWGNSLKATSNSGNPYLAKTQSDFDKVTEINKGLRPFPPSVPSDKAFNFIDKASQGDQNLEVKETLSVFERIVIKEALVGQYKPLPHMRLDPTVKYENVQGMNHLTKELEQTKFLTYLPHSGFHNQRIEIKNAFKLAKLLNRTLILPALRLGRPVAWQPSQQLVKLLENDELKYERFGACLDAHSPVDLKSATEQEECDYYSSWTSVPAGYILNIGALSKEVPIIDRPDLRESWLWHTLKLSQGEWLEVKDDSRYSYQIYESSMTPEALGSSSRYNFRLNVDELAPFNEARLLSFGSLFGSGRVILSSPEMKQWDQKIEKHQALNLPLLEKISDKAAERLGGRKNYLGLHLRVGNAFFKTQAADVIRTTFVDICKNILKLDQEKIDDLILKHDLIMKIKGETSTNLIGNLRSSREPNMGTSMFKRSDKVKYESNRWDDAIIKSSKKIHSDLVPGTNGPKEKKLKCRGKLHNDQEADKQYLKKLNLAIYLSTDVTFHSIQNNPAFSIFTYYFPCLFSLDDLNIRDSIPQETSDKRIGNRETPRTRNHKEIHESNGVINQKYSDDDEDKLTFHQMKSNLDGLDLDQFLIPILESMIVSKGSHVIGTKGSTFSSYLINFLHPTYLSEKQAQLH